MHEALTRMVLAGGDVSDVADLLVDTLGGSVLVLDRTDRVVAAHGSPADDDEAAVRTHSALSAVPALASALGGAIKESRGSGRCATVCRDGAVHRHVVAIAAATTYLGAFVLSRDGDLEPVDVRTLEHAAHIAALLTLAAGRGGQRRGARAGRAPHRADDRRSARSPPNSSSAREHGRSTRAASTSCWWSTAPATGTVTSPACLHDFVTPAGRPGRRASRSPDGAARRRRCGEGRRPGPPTFAAGAADPAPGLRHIHATRAGPTRLLLHHDHPVLCGAPRAGSRRRTHHDGRPRDLHHPVRPRRKPAHSRPS